MIERLDELARPEVAPSLARGVGRALVELGYASLTEFSLRSGRRADLLGVSGAGELVIVEIKSCLEDYRADGKWPEYLDYCDRFYFAVPASFPFATLPEDCGLMVADPYGAVIRRESPLRPLHSARRRAQILRFAQTAATRLTRLTDPR